jgi:hypothetical protein
MTVNITPGTAVCDITIAAHLREGVVWALHSLRQALYEPPEAGAYTRSLFRSI